MAEREQGTCLWVVSNNRRLCDEIQDALKGDGQSVKLITPAQLAESPLWRTTSVLPGAILLDIGNELDWGVTVIRDIKRAHIRSPIVVVSQEPSHEFGMKIVSQGISYVLPRDFDMQELRDVVSGLIKA